MNEPPTLGWLLAKWQDWGEEGTLRAKLTVPRWKGEGDRDVARLKQDAFTVELTKADKRMRAPMPANLQEIQY
ncbi:hypothetical protein FOZ61_009006 [Perkinsus olseni]|uniref:Uncharacterized protein n=1 Tax=Perkinsus olseni TaxID=32597 RepID=A0A7J6L2L0_PEROL|nr:hypothetical protein FOZ61_009006 [Perkinsus olseni]